MNCGCESPPREYLQLNRNYFPGIVSKMVRDSLVMDSASIENEYKGQFEY